MRVLIAWGVFCINALHYMLFRLRLLPQPDFRKYPTHWEPWLGSFLRWRRRMVVLHPERCPLQGPAVFAANHAKLDDPLFCWGAVDRATGGRTHIYFMMRDDFFVGWPWDYLPFSMNELTASSGCIQISRDSISLAQLKPLLAVLEAGEAFVMFPGRTRSRSGLFIEYREGVEEPGGVSFFLLHGSRRAGRPVPAVPVARTYDPSRKRTYVSFGESIQLPDGASRDSQRETDLAIAVAMSDQVVVTALHALCLLLYLACLHGKGAPVPKVQLFAQATGVLNAVKQRVNAEPIDGEPLDLETPLGWLARQGVISVHARSVRPDAVRILSVPELDTKYRKRNPVKYFVNQVLHLRAVTDAAEAVYFGVVHHGKMQDL